MDMIHNFPFFSILIALFSSTICSVLPGKIAKWVNTAVIIIAGVMSGTVLWYVSATGKCFVYLMGHFPAPWGNEIRAGILEGAMALFFVSRNRKADSEEPAICGIIRFIK